MIVIHFWYIVSNVFVYLSGLNLIFVPGCRAANETDDAYAYSEEKTELETYSPELTEPIPKDFFEGVEKVGAFEDVSNGSDAETSTKSSDLCTEAVTELTISLMSVVNQTNSGSEATTVIGDLYTDSTTTPVAPPTFSDASTKTADLYTESITSPNSPSGMSTDIYNETTITPTILSSSSDAATNTSDLYTDSMKNDIFAAESTTKAVTSDGNISESTTVADFSTNAPSTSSSEPAANVTNESATNNASISEQSIAPAKELGSQDLSFSTKLPEKSNELVERSTQPLVSRSTKDTLEELYDEDAKHTTKFTPRYEEGYYDPRRAPTRYGQREEVVKTTPWKYASDYTIGIRDYNLILYAVNNTLVLEKGSLLNYVYFVFKEILHINMTLCDIRYCRYLRSKTHDNTKKVPPVLVAFTKMDVKNEILHKRKMLRPTGIKVEHDMPKKILDEQNALLKPLMDKYRAMGQYVVVRSGKLLVEGKVLTQINLPDKYTYDPMQTFVSYVSSTLKPTTTPGIYQLPRDLNLMDYGFGGDKKSGRKKKGAKGAGGKKKRKPVIRIPLDDEIGDELSVEVLFTTRKFW